MLKDSKLTQRTGRALLELAIGLAMADAEGAEMRTLLGDGARISEDFREGHIAHGFRARTETALAARKSRNPFISD